MCLFLESPFCCIDLYVYFVIILFLFCFFTEVYLQFEKQSLLFPLPNKPQQEQHYGQVLELANTSQKYFFQNI